MKAIRRNSILAIVALVLAALAFCLPIGADTVENDDLAVDLASENRVTLVTSEGKTDYNIIYASDAVNDDNAIANELRSELYFKYDAILSVGIDVISDEKPHEIIIGDTVREATKEFKEYVMEHSEDGKYLVTGIAYLDGKLVFLSSHAEGYTYYRDMLFSLLTEDGMIVTEGLYDVKKILYTDYLEEMRQKAEAEKEAARAEKLEKLYEMQNGFTQEQFGEYKPMIGENGFYQESPYQKPWFYPTLGDHPRILLNKGDIDVVKALLADPQYAKLAENFWAYADADINFGILKDTKGDSGEFYRWDQAMLGRITCKAMAYLLTGDEAYGLEAIVSIKNYMLTYKYTADIHSDIYHGGSEVLFVASIVRDWCHELVTEDDINHLLAGIPNLCISTMEINYPPTNMGYVSGHGTGPQFLRDMTTMANAFADDAPDWWELVAGRYFEYYLKVANESYGQGWISQGTANYAYNKINVMMWAAMNVYTATGEIVFNEQANDSMYFLLSHTMPRTGNYFQTGDGGRNATGASRSWEFTAFFLAAALYKDPVIFANCRDLTEGFSVSYNGSVGMLTPAMQLAVMSVYMREGEDTGDWRYKDIPLIQYFDAPAGQMTARDSWTDDDAAVVLMRIGDKTMSNHDCDDHGTFQIYYKGLLACTSGVYAKYGGYIHKYYLQATVSHNGLLIFNPAYADETPDYGKNEDGTDNTDVINNASRYFYSGSQQRRREAGSYEIWTSGEYDMGVTTGASVGYFDDGSAEYGYIAGDITNAYPDDTVEFVSRRMLTVYTGDAEFPMLFYVFDTVTSKDESFKKTFLLHTVKEPEVNAETMSASIVEGDGKMIVHSLHGGQSITKIGGEGKAYWINGKNCVDQYKRDDSYKTIWGRIEIEAIGEKTTYFNTLMYVTDKKNENTLSVDKFESDSVYGSKIANVITVFTKSNTSAFKEFSFTTEGKGLYRYYLSGIEQGTWNVKVDGKSIAYTYSSEGEGFVSFIAPTGEITLTPGSDVIGANGGRIQYSTGGGVLPEDAPYTYNNEVVTPLPAVVTKEDATFVGWYTTPTFDKGTEITEIAIGTEGLVRLYAKWLNVYVNEDYTETTVNVVESNKSIGAITYSASNKPGASFTTAKDGNDVGYLLWKKGPKDPAIGFYYGTRNLAETAPEDNCVSYEFKLSRDGENPVVPAALRFIGGKDVSGATMSPTVKMTLFSINSDGDVKFAGNTITTLKADKITSLRFVADFDKCEMRVYGEDYSIIASAPLELPEKLGATNGAELKSCITNQLIHFYASNGGTGEEALRIYGIRIEDNDVFTPRIPEIKNQILYQLAGGELPKGAPGSYSATEPTTLPIPTRENSVFAGWYTTETFDPETLITEIPAGDGDDIPVYAKWLATYVSEDYSESEVLVTEVMTAVNGVSYNAKYQGAIFSTKTDEGGRRYLEWQKGTADPSLSVTAGRYNITNSSESVISFTYTLAKDGDKPLPELNFRLLANHDVNGTKLSSSAKTTFLYLNASGKLTLPGKTEIGYITGGSPATVRIAIDFDKLTIYAYDESGEVIGQEPFTIPASTGAASGRELMKCYTGYVFQCYASKSGGEERFVRFYQIKVEEGNAFASLLSNPIDYVTGGGTLPEDAPLTYSNDEPTKLPETLTLPNATFLGWYTTPDFAEGTRVTEVPTDAKGAFTVYAKWSKVLAKEDYSATEINIEGINKTYNGIGYSSNSNPGVTYVTKTDSEGRRYLEWTKGTGDPAMSIVKGDNNITNIASDEVSYTIRLSKDGENTAPKIDFRIIANHDVNGTKLSPTQKTTVIMLENDTFKLANKTAVATLSQDEITTLRLVVDFGDLEMRFYDENGEIMARETFAIPAATGALTGKELMKCYTQTTIHLYSYKSGAEDTAPKVIRIYELSCAEGDIFAK